MILCSLGRGKSKMIKKLKSMLSFFLVGLIILNIYLIQVSTANAQNNISVTINNQNVVFNEDMGFPFVDTNGRTQVPFRATMEAFGATVNWDDEKNMAYVQKGNTVIYVPINQNYIIVNGLTVQNDTSASVVNSRTYCPIRKILESFGAEVNWDANIKTVIVSKDNNRETGEKIDPELAKYIPSRVEKYQFAYLNIKGDSIKEAMISWNNGSSEILMFEKENGEWTQFYQHSTDINVYSGLNNIYLGFIHINNYEVPIFLQFGELYSYNYQSLSIIKYNSLENKIAEYQDGLLQMVNEAIVLLDSSPIAIDSANNIIKVKEAQQTESFFWDGTKLAKKSYKDDLILSILGKNYDNQISVLGVPLTTKDHYAYNLKTGKNDQKYMIVSYYKGFNTCFDVGSNKITEIVLCNYADTNLFNIKYGMTGDQIRAVLGPAEGKASLMDPGSYILFYQNDGYRLFIDYGDIKLTKMGSIRIMEMEK